MCREFPYDFRMRIGGKAQAAISLWNNHREELVGLEKAPGLWRQVAQLPIDLPVVEHGAQLLDRSIDKGLLIGRQLGGRFGEQFCPVRIASKQIGVPPDVASFN